MAEKAREREKLRCAGRYVVELIQAGLQGEKAAEKPQDIPWELVWNLVKKNHVEGMSAYGMKTLQKLPPKEMEKVWSAMPEYIVYRTLRMDIEREQILKEMRQRGLSYFPLKGIYIKDYYPLPGMRFMTDNDILYKYAKTEKKSQGNDNKEASRIMRQIMERRGYHLKEKGEVHEIYLKKPFYCFEMHKKLVSKLKTFYWYYEDPWKYAIQDLKDDHAYYFKKEDEFIYILVHCYMHFSEAGCGIRFLTDIYVMLEKYGSELDKKYVSEELEKLNLTVFAEKIITTAQKAFGKDNIDFTEEEAELLDYMMFTGTFGNVEQLLKNIANGSRFYYVWKRLFPKKEWWEIYYPVCKGRPWMYLPCWVYRMVVGSYKKQDNIRLFFKNTTKKREGKM